MSPTSKGKKDLRVVLNAETVTLLRRLAGVTERSASALVEEALQDYFAKEQIQQVIDLYNLEAEVDDSNDG